MDSRQAIALLTWVNQVDARVMLNEASAEVWAFVLAPVELAEAKQAVMEHYRSVEGLAASPAAVRKRALAIRSAREAGQRAIEATPDVWGDPNMLRSVNPERWDELKALGAAERRMALGLPVDAA
jgi:hypothetical protein